MAVGVSAFAGQALGCAPGPYLLDSPELAQTAFGLGVAHPPGEPLALLWGKLWTLLPVGSVAFRVGLSQAAATAIAAVLLLRLALRLLARLDRDGALPAATRALLAAAAALAFAFAPGVVIVSVRPEVYALQTALSLAALLCAWRALDPGQNAGGEGREEGDARWLLAAAGFIGLGVANHPLVAGLTGLGATVAALPFLRARRAPLVGWSVVALLLGLAVVAYLPARAAALFAHGPADTIAWGDARTPAGLAWVLSARTFAAKSAVVHTAASPGDLPYVLMEELEIVFALLAPLGALLLLRRSDLRLPALLVLVGWAGGVAAPLLAGFDPANPDVRGYLGPAIALTALLSTAAVAAGLAPMKRWNRAWLTPALAALLLLATLTRFPSGAAYPGLRRSAAADVIIGEQLAELPARAVLLTAHFESAFLVGYQRLVEGRRPDVAWAHLGFLGHPGYRARMMAAEPALRAALAAPLTAESVLALDRQRPVRLEADPHLAPALRARLVPEGSTWRPRAAGDRPVPRWPPALAFDEAARDRQVRGFVAWRAYSDAVQACEHQLPEIARVQLSVLERLLPQDQRARALATGCAALSNKPGILRKAP